MPTSLFDDIMTESAIPALETVFGVAAVHANDAGENVAVIVLMQTELVPTGEYGERMELRMTLELAKSNYAIIGDEFSIENDPTDDDPTPSPTVWKTTQLLSDDGYMQKFAVIEVP